MATRVKYCNGLTLLYYIKDGNIYKMKWIILLLICVQVNSYCTCSVDEAIYKNNECCGPAVGTCADSSSSFNGCDCCGKTLLRSVHEVLAGLDYTDSSTKTITEPFYISYDGTRLYDTTGALQAHGWGSGAGSTLDKSDTYAFLGAHNLCGGVPCTDGIILAGASAVAYTAITATYPPIHGGVDWPFDMDSIFYSTVTSVTNLPGFYVDGDTEYSVVKNNTQWELQYSSGHPIIKFTTAGVPIPLADSGTCGVEFPVDNAGALGLCMKDPKTGGSITNVFNGF